MWGVIGSVSAAIIHGKWYHSQEILNPIKLYQHYFCIIGEMTAMQFIEPTLRLKTWSPCWFHFANEKEYTSRVKWITMIWKLSLIANKIFQLRNRRPYKEPKLVPLECINLQVQIKVMTVSTGCDEVGILTLLLLAVWSSLNYLTSLCLYCSSVKWGTIIATTP